MDRRPGDPNKGDIPWEEIWQKISGKKSEADNWSPQKKGRLIGIVIGVVFVIWLLTGIYTVGPGEVGIVRTFGEHTATTSPGLNYHWAWPIQNVKKVDIAEIRSTEVGFFWKGELKNDYETESKMLTGDGNIAKVWLQVQYQVDNPEAFVFNVRDPEQVIHSAAEVVLRGVVGQMDVDMVLTTNIDEIGRKTQNDLQMLLDSYGTGLQIFAVNVIDTFPPEEVNAAYEDVSTANQETETKINEAQAYYADHVPKAKGEKEKLILEAEAYKEKRILEAQGDASKFLQILKQHEVPVAFQVLAENGIGEASKVLIQVAAGDEDSETVEKTTSLTREKLFEIMAQLGSVGGASQVDDLTGQRLVAAFEQLDLEDEFNTAFAKAIQLTEKRMFLETMQEVLPGVEKFILDTDGNSNIVPFLPLKDLVEASSSLSGSDATGEVK